MSGSEELARLLKQMSDKDEGAFERLYAGTKRKLFSIVFNQQLGAVLGNRRIIYYFRKILFYRDARYGRRDSPRPDRCLHRSPATRKRPPAVTR